MIFLVYFKRGAVGGGEFCICKYIKYIYILKEKFGSFKRVGEIKLFYLKKRV